ncbi:LAFE_0C02828g1_1 [Lachancea fermentati]|uniref:LAFE_0C02828g1_1 n=1 Tax=Lachancea fermentati TaxID=4955 RepID=A0A1G4M949_LACFM|nr:LAFE_0C02828g1_1 [Lachancea fermentati]
MLSAAGAADKAARLPACYGRRFSQSLAATAIAVKDYSTLACVLSRLLASSHACLRPLTLACVLSRLLASSARSPPLSRPLLRSIRACKVSPCRSRCLGDKTRTGGKGGSTKAKTGQHPYKAHQSALSAVATSQRPHNLSPLTIGVNETSSSPL